MQNRRILLKRQLRRLLGRSKAFRCDQRAAVAVEFALLALPFFTLVAAILETALVFFAGQVLESAVQDSSRLIRTGQAQQQGYRPARYRQELCNGLYGLFDCESDRLLVQVKVLNKFSEVSAAIAAPISAECSTNPAACTWTGAETYDFGGTSSIVVVQAYYKWPTIVDLPWFNLANQAGGDRLLSGVRVFRNEPF